MNRADKLAVLQRWQAEMLRSETKLEPIIQALGLEPESKLCELVWNLQEALTDLAAQAVGDTSEWLKWYAWENDMGINGLEAGATGEMRPIAGFDDLLWLLEAA